MFPFWDTVVAPLISASGAKRIIEIGALRGETTVLMLDALGPDAELHVVDPVPDFDPEEHVRRFPGRYIFHRDLSLNVLPDADAFDVALVDGDHNWYTVYNELRLLREASRRQRRTLPLLILHDVAWPYGRRDLYYSPDQIPAEFRQPYARRGMRPGRKELLPRGGMNVTLDNALVEGGPRNGVMTAVDDFIAEHDRPLRLVVLPIYFGLAIVAEERLLDEKPALRRLLDELENPAGKQGLLELSERIRIDATVFEHNIMRVRDEQLTSTRERYLTLLRSTLLDLPYLENEVRLEYLLQRATQGAPVVADLLKSPASLLRKELQRLELQREAGRTAGADTTSAYFPYTAMGSVKLDHLDRVLHTIGDEKVPGDLLECEPGRGGAAVYMRGYLEAAGLPGRDVWVAGTFRSSPAGRPPRPLTEGGIDDLLADLTQVRSAFDRFGLLDDRVRFLQGELDASLADAAITEIALVRIGAGIGAEAANVLDRVYDRLSDGGFVVVEDASEPGCEQAVDTFRSRRKITSPIERIGWSGLSWRKDAAAAPAATSKSSSDATVLHRTPLAPPAPVGVIDLSVVVVFYNMRREAARTLRSLSRAYQREVDDLDYEVVVVENGSAPDERLGEEFVQSFGPEFRYLDLGDDATPSPTGALNRGIAVARGANYALMIDGAHVVTPGVLHHGMAGLRSYEPAVVATQQWYVGPGQQPVVVDKGYDQDREDELFSTINWPSDGYRLFEISHFIGDRDWLDGILESNCLFAPRSLLEQVGGFDDSFSMPGGGYTNLDLWERLGSSPGVTTVTILGEGSFHQVHGGTTTNDGAHDDRRSKIFAYGEHYEELRGRLLRGPTKPMHYVGALATESSRRTRSRRMTASSFAGQRAIDGPDGLPATPEPMPEELKSAAIEMYWRGLAWQQTEWLGRPVPAAPTDLFVYQELIASVRPDWIIETGTAGGGRALFLASICDLLGSGTVLSLHDDGSPRPEHPRVTYLDQAAHEGNAARRVREITGDDPRALVILGSKARAPRLVKEFANLSPLVPVGSYVVVENTVVNGHPVWPGYGSGPFEAVRKILATNGDFVQDTSWEKHVVTFNPGGFLRRIS
jgi:cephalosporin hydroxylase